MPENISDTNTKNANGVHNRENCNEVEAFFQRAVMRRLNPEHRNVDTARIIP